MNLTIKRVFLIFHFCLILLENFCKTINILRFEHLNYNLSLLKYIFLQFSILNK